VGPTFPGAGVGLAPAAGFGRFGVGFPAFYSLPIVASPYAVAPAAPSVTIVQQFGSPAAAPAAPQEAVRSEIREYPRAAASPVGPGAYAIVLKDGAVHSAIAVTAQYNEIHYVDPAGEHHRLPAGAVDREATRKRNEERGLRLSLP
jgi:hypothetical protein